MDIFLYCLIFLLIILLILILAMSNYYKNVLNFYNSDMKHKIIEVTQNMFEIMGKDIPADERFENLNNSLINKLGIDYSSILLYDGNTYEVKASNVEDEYKGILADIASDNNFKGNISKNNSKYITVPQNQTLLYKSAIERNIKSALFIPIYYNNKYIGFWLVESKKVQAYEKFIDEYIESMRKNLSIFIEDTEFHNTLEIARNEDEQTAFYNNIYLYSNTRKIISKYDNSVMVLIGLVGLPEVNESYSRDTGNILLAKFANITKETLPKESICIRYSGKKFIVILPNKTAQAVQPQIEKLLSKYKGIYEYVDDKQVNVDTQILIHTFRKQSNIEKEVQKLDKYMDGMKARNTIKII